MIDLAYLLSILQIHVSRIFSRLNKLFYVPISNIQSSDPPIDNICNKFNTILLESGLNIDIFFDTIAQFINCISDSLNLKCYK